MERETWPELGYSLTRRLQIKINNKNECFNDSEVIFKLLSPLNFNLYGFLKSFTPENDLREVEQLFAFMIIIITCLSK